LKCCSEKQAPQNRLNEDKYRWIKSSDRLRP